MAFSFDMTKDPSIAELAPLYAAVLGPDGPPEIVLNGTTEAAARVWLRRQQDRYRRTVGNRSGLIQKLNLADRVVFRDADAEGDQAG